MLKLLMYKWCSMATVRHIYAQVAGVQKATVRLSAYAEGLPKTIVKWLRSFLLTGTIESLKLLM